MGVRLHCRHPLGYELALELGSLEAAEIMARSLSKKHYTPVSSAGEPATAREAPLMHLLQEAHQMLQQTHQMLRDAHQRADRFRSVAPRPAAPEEAPATRELLERLDRVERLFQDLRKPLGEISRDMAPALASPRAAPAAAAPDPSSRTALFPETWRAILAYLHAHPGPQRPVDVQHGLGWSKTTRDSLRRMVEAGLVVRRAVGSYELARAAPGERASR
jgi:hypothetical protein